MTSGNSDPSDDDLGARLRAARERVERETGPSTGRSGLPRTQTGLAFRVGVELAAGLVVGGGIGWLLDSWLHTMPAMTIVFFILGAAAGILNVYRTAMDINRAAGRGGNENGAAGNGAPKKGSDRGGRP
ncbi:MAG: AtpZ/AtpI family protein [Rhodospirillaceae bacterium]|nr:AtpZ/AtpI family protein [Rhodospirillaceae bacterium]